MAVIIAALPFSPPVLAADLPINSSDDATGIMYGWYGEASAGIGFGELTVQLGDREESDNESGFVGRVGFGKALTENIRLGVEGSFAAYSQSEAVVDLDIYVWSVMAVAYYDFRNETRFTPYLGAGAGFGFTDLNASVNLPDIFTVSDSETSTHAAFKLAAGVAFDITENMQVYTDYNFIYLHEAKLFDDFDINSNQNTINIGLRYFF